MNTLLLITTIVLAFMTCMAAGLGLGGMGSAKKSIQGWIAPLLIATLVTSYLYGGVTSAIVAGVIVITASLLLTVAINKRHGGLDYDRQMHDARNLDSDTIFMRMMEKHDKNDKQK